MLLKLETPPGFTAPLGQGHDGDLFVPTPNQPPVRRPRGRPRKPKSVSALTSMEIQSFEEVTNEEVGRNYPEDDGLLIPYAQWINRDCQWKGDSEYRGLIEGFLDSNHLEKLMNRPFGNFMRLDDAKYSGRIINCILQSQLVSSDDDKISFMVFGETVDFTEDDFGVVSGLNTTANVDISMLKLSKNRLKEKYFRNPEEDLNKKGNKKDNKWNLKLYDLLDFIEHYSTYVRKKPKNPNMRRVSAARFDVPLDLDDAVKLAEVYLITSVLLGRPLTRVVENQHMIIVDHEDVNRSYQWGTEMYRSLIPHLKTLIKVDSDSGSYMFPGMPFLFCCWVAQVFTDLRQFFDVVERKMKPLMLRYRCTSFPKYEVLCDQFFFNEQYWETARVKRIKHKSKSKGDSTSKSTSKLPSKSTSKTSSTTGFVDLNEAVKVLTTNMKAYFPNERRIQSMIDSSQQNVMTGLVDMEKRIMDHVDKKFDALLLLVAKSKTSNVGEDCGDERTPLVSGEQRTPFVHGDFSDGQDSFFQRSTNPIKTSDGQDFTTEKINEIIDNVVAEHKDDGSDNIDEAIVTDELENEPFNPDSVYDKENPSADLLQKCQSANDDTSLKGTEEAKNGEKSVHQEESEKVQALVDAGLLVFPSEENSQQSQPGDDQIFETPPAPLGQGQDGDLFVPTPNQPTVRRPRGRPRKPKSVSALTKVPAVAATETPVVPPPNVSPMGSSKDTRLEMPCDEDEGEHIETKINLNPLLRLKKPPESPCRKECSPHALEISKTLIPQVMSMLVSHLTSGSSQNIDAMVDHANKAFMTLDWLKADYSSFYLDVKEFITYHYDLLTRERDKEMQPFLELKTRYSDAMVCANDLEKNILHTQANIQTAKEKKEPLKRRIAEATDIIDRLKKEVADIEWDEKVLKTKKRKYVAAHEASQGEAQKLRSQMEEAECAIEQRKNAALNGIEATTRRLQSIHS